MAPPVFTPVAYTALLYAGLVTALLSSSLCHAGNGDLSKVEVDMTVEDYGEPQKLRCHNCYLSVHGQDCMTLEDFSKVEVQECLADEPFCMVQRLYTNDELTTFTRKCSRDCEDGCQSAGDNYKLEYCSTCCKEDFCNVGSGGSTPTPSSPLLPLLLPLLSTLSGLVMRAFV